MSLRRLITPAILMATTACASDYDLHKNNEKNLAPEDESTLVETPSEETDVTEPDDTGEPEDTDDTGTPDTGEEETPEEEEIPAYPFREVIDACLGLDEDDCLISLEEGGVAYGCEVSALEERALLEEGLIESARDAAGDETLTLEDIKDGAAPAVVRATYALHISGLNGEDTWAEYATIQIHFGTDETVYDDIFTPYDGLAVDTVRCVGDRRSYEIDQDPSTVSFEPLDVYNAFWPANEGPNGALNIRDFRVSGYNDTLKVFGHDYDTTDSNWVVSPSESALDDESEAVINAAYTLTGDPGASTSVSTVLTY